MTGEANIDTNDQMNEPLWGIKPESESIVEDTFENHEPHGNI